MLKAYLEKLKMYTHVQKAAFATKALTVLLGFVFTLIFALNQSISPFTVGSIFQDKNHVASLQQNPLKNNYEVFGFAPYWTLNKMDNVDFSVLTTMAYFGIGVNADGSLDETSPGYEKFYSDTATSLFQKAHQNGTRVVLTVTQMDNPTISSFLANKEAQKIAINNIARAVSSRGIDGVNIDFEFIGQGDSEIRQNFSKFVHDLTSALHQNIQGSYVTVSVYASSAKDKKIYDIASLSHSTDGIFMMAYDFATSGSDNAMPTAPLYGYKEGKYWYDVSTAVEDFLKVMPKEKLILGLPWYGYDFPVASPAVKAEKDYGYYSYYWYRGRKYRTFIGRQGAHASTYALAKSDITPDMKGWDEQGQVGWEAYKSDDGWRMIFLDDERSLAVKYDFAKNKNLGGVGMWALGFDDGNTELWQLLASKFGKKLVASNIQP